MDQTQVSGEPLRLNLPAMLCRIWAQSGREVWTQISPRLPSRLPQRPGVFWLIPELFAVVPTAGDSALVEVAFYCAQRLFAEAKVLSGERQLALAALVFPGQVHLAAGGADPIPSPVLEDLQQRPPQLIPNTIYLSGHATHALESRWSLLESGEYRGRSGAVLPLWQLLEPRPGVAPWRNMELLGRQPETVPRHAVTSALQELAEAPSLLVSGPIGTGKTRAVWETLDGGRGRSLWARSWSTRSGGPSIARQILRQVLPRFTTLRPGVSLELVEKLALRDRQTPLGDWWAEVDPQQQHELEQVLIALLQLLVKERDQPIRLICDDLESVNERDVRLLQRLLELPEMGQSFQLVLIARSGAPWPEPSRDLPRVEIPPFRGGDLESFAEEVLADLSLPAEVQGRFLEASGGCPFALEEGILQLIRRKHLRRLYGNFFFNGTSDTDFEPSVRLVKHLDAETRRLGDATPLRILSLAGAAVPAPDLEETAKTLGAPISMVWQPPFLTSGLLREAPSPWGAAVALGCRAHAQSLARTVAHESVQPARHCLGRLLAAKSEDPRASWQAYSLLAGTADAVAPLLAAAEQGDTQIDRRLLFEALRDEVEAHRERRGDTKSELELLWRLLPLARRMGILRNLGDALDRALELAAAEPERLMALTTLKAEHDQNEGRFSEAEAGIHFALELVQNSDERRKALLFISLGRLLLRQERFRKARKLFEELLPMLDRPGSGSLAATCRFYLGNVAFHENRYELAMKYHQQALEDRRRLELVRSLGASLCALGAVQLAMGNYPLSLKYYREAEENLERHGKEGEISFALMGVGRALSRVGDFIGASQPLRRALTERVDRDDIAGEAIARLEVAQNHLLLNQAEPALEEARQAHFRLSLLATSAAPVGDCEQLLGRILLHLRRVDEAQEHFENALASHRHHGRIIAATFDQAWLLETAQAQGRKEEARALISDLEAVLDNLRYPESGEAIDLRLFRACEWLADSGDEVREPFPYLRRAYRELLRKTAFLDPELRNRFLFQIPDNRAILDAATRHSLSLPALVSSPTAARRGDSPPS